MASELPRLSPLDLLLHLADLDKNSFELPDNHELVVCPRGQELSIWRKSHTIDGFCVASIEIVKIRWRNLENRVLLDLELPKPDSSITICVKTRGDKIFGRIWVNIKRHDFILLIVPENLRDFNLHY